jgi:hypothetical protein
MAEIMRTIWLSGGDEAVIFTNYLVVLVGCLDAKVGTRIYTRMTVLITTLTRITGTAPVEPEPTPQSHPAEKALNVGHF